MNSYCKVSLFWVFSQVRCGRGDRSMWSLAVVGWFDGTDVNVMWTFGCDCVKAGAGVRVQRLNPPRGVADRPNRARIRGEPDVFTHNSPAGWICLCNWWRWSVFGIRRRYLDVFPLSGRCWWISLLYPACLGRDVTMATPKRCVHVLDGGEREAFVTETSSLAVD